MGIFSKLRESVEAKKEAQRTHKENILRIESEVKEKMENSPLVAELLDCILHGEKWIVAGQNLNDTCIRNVEVEWNLIYIEWIGFHYERKVVETTGKPYTSKVEDILKTFSFVFAEHGYSPLKPYVDAETGIEVPMDRMCFILASILDEHMSQTIKNYTHYVKHEYGAYDKIYYVTTQRHDPRLHCAGRAYYRYMVPDTNSQGPLQEWI